MKASLLVLALSCVVALCLATPRSAAEPAEGLSVGAHAEDFGLRMLDPATGALGRMVWLSDFVGAQASSPKQAVLLSFYANWCQACIAELPALQRMQDAYAESGLQILGVHVRADGEDAEQAQRRASELLRERGVRYPVLFDRFTQRNQLVYLGARPVLPSHVLIDAAGSIVARFHGALETHWTALDADIAKQLGAAPVTRAPRQAVSP